MLLMIIIGSDLYLDRLYVGMSLLSLQQREFSKGFHQNKKKEIYPV